METCAECRWWACDGESIGTCRRYPPVWKGLFPLVNKDVWCGQFAARETEIGESDFSATVYVKRGVPKESPLQERGFRLLDEGLWEKEVAGKRREKRWMVELRKDETLPFTCKNCVAVYDSCKCAFLSELVENEMFNPEKNGRIEDCPAEEVEVDI